MLYRFPPRSGLIRLSLPIATRWFCAGKREIFGSYLSLLIESSWQSPRKVFDFYRDFDVMDLRFFPGFKKRLYKQILTWIMCRNTFLQLGAECRTVRLVLCQGSLEPCHNNNNIYNGGKRPWALQSGAPGARIKTHAGALLSLSLSLPFDSFFFTPLTKTIMVNTSDTGYGQEEGVELMSQNDVR